MANPLYENSLRIINPDTSKGSDRPKGGDSGNPTWLTQVQWETNLSYPKVRWINESSTTGKHKHLFYDLIHFYDNFIDGDLIDEYTLIDGKSYGVVLQACSLG